jgi:hexosaminidase
MKKILFSTYFIGLFISAFAQSSSQKIAIIPEPVSVEMKEGNFTLPKDILLKTPANIELGVTIKYLTEKLSVPAGCNVRIANDNTQQANITLELNKTANEKIGDEGYELFVNPNHVLITANKPAGLFYGVQTFLQLLPPEIENKKLVSGVKWQAPAVKITDYPRVGWRGLMLDVSRHFFTVDEVKQYINNMAKYKYNIFHWHLSDDEGWRVEIKSLPKLTEIGAWRVDKVGNFGTFSNPLPDEPKTYGGFYTQEQIKDIVKYAKERFINVLPEIDVPGHSLSIIASYPELSCTPGAEKYNVRAGEPIMDWSRGAPPIAMIDNTLCPANEKVYEFMDKVMTELAQLFPFDYIHVGGDEAPHNFWEKNPQVQDLMKREGLKTIPQVQAYFEKRLEKIVNAKGKKMMGWDELLEGGVNKTTAIMSWRGTQAGIDASNAGHYVVMSPTQYAYIDYMQSDEATEPRVYASLRLNKTYEFEPVPKGANAKFILGGQANLWAEQVYNIRQAEYMTWPRGFAIAESVWSPAENKNWNRFVAKTEEHFKRLGEAQTKYSIGIYEPIVSFKKLTDDKYQITMQTEIDGLEIHYSFDNSEPDSFYPKYTQPLTIPKDAQKLRIVTYKNGQQAGRQMIIGKEDWKRRAK